MNIFNKEGLKDLIINRYKGGEYKYNNRFYNVEYSYEDRYFGSIEIVVDTITKCGGVLVDEVETNDFDYMVMFSLQGEVFVITGSMYNGMIEQVYNKDIFSVEGEERDKLANTIRAIANSL